MKIKIITRVLNEKYFLDTYIRYYLDMGVDEIHFFDSQSTDGTLESIKAWEKKDKRIQLIKSSKKFRHTSVSKQTEVCNMVLQQTVKDYKKEKEETWWMLLDIDEYVQPPQEGLRQFFEKADRNIIRCVFFEWYLPREVAEKNISAAEALEQIRAGNARGRLTDLWGDPFYKDYVLRLAPDTIKDVSRFRIISGNHRFLLDKETVVPDNTPFLVIDHLRGVAMSVNQNRINRGLLLMEEQQKKMQDNWTYEHFKKMKTEVSDYSELYQKVLKSKPELDAILETVPQYDNSQSKYNKIIYGS